MISKNTKKAPLAHAGGAFSFVSNCAGGGRGIEPRAAAVQSLGFAEFGEHCINTNRACLFHELA